jgi:hypothetical protein
MVVRVRLWSNTNPERGEAPIGQNPVWAGGGDHHTRLQIVSLESFAAPLFLWCCVCTWKNVGT